MHFSVMQLALIFGIVILLFGTKKLSSVGTDLGGAIRGFRSAMKEGQQTNDEIQDLMTIESKPINKPHATFYKFKKRIP